MNAHSMPTAAPQRPGGYVSSAEGVAADELKQFIERLERLEEEKAGIMGDIKEVFAELKGRGLRRQGGAHHPADPQAGSQRAPGAGGDPRTLPAGPRHGVGAGSPPAGIIPSGQSTGGFAPPSRSAAARRGRLGGIGQAEGSARIPRGVEVRVPSTVWYSSTVTCPTTSGCGFFSACAPSRSAARGGLAHFHSPY